MEKIVVIDFGSQYSHLIVSKLRKLKVFSEIKSPELRPEELKEVKGIIFSGSPLRIVEPTAPGIDKRIFKLKIPILGICYGHQLLGREIGGKVRESKIKEFGKTVLKTQDKSGILEGLKDDELVWMSHNDEVSKLPRGFKISAQTENCQIAVMENPKKKFFGVQFHPEVSHTEGGLKIFDNFLKICRVKRDWEIPGLIEEIIKDIREKVGKRKVFLLASGGVDSTVTLAILIKALGTERVFAFYVDSGLGRKNEAEEIKKLFRKSGFKNIGLIKAENRFLKNLEKISDPEEKREIIGRLFIELWKEKIKNFAPEDWLLAQGTIYPDTIETAGTIRSERIKTHHNRAEAVKELLKRGEIIEPLAFFYKDEVREIGKELGLPDELVRRHPFPGPGMAVRIICSDFSFWQDKKINLPEELPLGELEILCQKFSLKPYLLPIKTVGVQADQRVYNKPVLLSGKTDWQTLQQVSSEITNHFKGLINRVLYLIYPETFDPKTLKLKRAGLSKERIFLVKEADWQVEKLLKEKGLWREIWQIPVILAPLSFSGLGETLILRPVLSENAMTADFAKIPGPVLQEIVEKLLLLPEICEPKKVSPIELILYDITTKPPATIEWE